MLGQEYPCGTPAKIGWKEEKLPFILTENCLLDRNEAMESGDNLVS